MTNLRHPEAVVKETDVNLLKQRSHELQMTDSYIVSKTKFEIELTMIKALNPQKWYEKLKYGIVGSLALIFIKWPF